MKELSGDVDGQATAAGFDAQERKLNLMRKELDSVTEDLGDLQKLKSEV